MAESLEEFLNPSIPEKNVKVSGSLTCQECEEIVSEGHIDEDEMALIYRCSRGHESRIKI